MNDKALKTAKYEWGNSFRVLKAFLPVWHSVFAITFIKGERKNKGAESIDNIVRYVIIFNT